MTADRYRNRVAKLFDAAEIKIGGSRPWDIHVHEPAFYRRLLAEGARGAGESYMDGWWDVDQLDEFFCRVMKADLAQRLKSWHFWIDLARARLLNLQSRSRAFAVGEKHYDLGNELYKSMLDRRMIYSCGYWRDAENLDEAQEAKLDLVCRKLQFEPGMRVLDVGCGWGGAAKYMVRHHDVEVTGITVSREQASHTEQTCRGLPIEIRLQDYRELKGEYDRIFSIGMFEHVGCKNYRTFMRIVRRCLVRNGLFLLQTIGGSRSVSTIDPWIERHIFPNSMLPSVVQISTAAEGLFVLEDWHNFGTDYDKTLRHWFRNFDREWPLLKKDYDDRFYRMWKYYLLSSAGSFRARTIHLWQIVMSPDGVPGGYESMR